MGSEGVGDLQFRPQLIFYFTRVLHKIVARYPLSLSFSLSTLFAYARAFLRGQIGSPALELRD